MAFGITPAQYSRLKIEAKQDAVKAGKETARFLNFLTFAGKEAAMHTKSGRKFIRGLEYEKRKFAATPGERFYTHDHRKLTRAVGYLKSHKGLSRAVKARIVRGFKKHVAKHQMKIAAIHRGHRGQLGGRMLFGY